MDRRKKRKKGERRHHGKHGFVKEKKILQGLRVDTAGILDTGEAGSCLGSLHVVPQVVERHSGEDRLRAVGAAAAIPMTSPAFEDTRKLGHAMKFRKKT